MIVFLNGEFVPEEKAVISVFDRGFLFGDGLFEAMLVRRGEIFRWRQHVERLQRGAPLNDPDKATFYGGGAKGYTDYPALGKALDPAQ